MVKITGILSRIVRYANDLNRKKYSNKSGVHVYNKSVSMLASIMGEGDFPSDRDGSLAVSLLGVNIVEFGSTCTFRPTCRRKFRVVCKEVNYMPKGAVT